MDTTCNSSFAGCQNLRAPYLSGPRFLHWFEVEPGKGKSGVVVGFQTNGGADNRCEWLRSEGQLEYPIGRSGWCFQCSGQEHCPYCRGTGYREYPAFEANEGECCQECKA
jgi:hypothetical protein